MHYVYILYSPKLDRYCIGETADPDIRLDHHVQGHQRYTKRTNDWIRVFLKSTATAEEAREIERTIKRSKSRKSIQRWINGPDNELHTP